MFSSCAFETHRPCTAQAQSHKGGDGSESYRGTEGSSGGHSGTASELRGAPRPTWRGDQARSSRRLAGPQSFLEVAMVELLFALPPLQQSPLLACTAGPAVFSFALQLPLYSNNMLYNKMIFCYKICNI